MPRLVLQQLEDLRWVNGYGPLIPMTAGDQETAAALEKSLA